jgi:hypothetical protein
MRTEPNMEEAFLDIHNCRYKYEIENSCTKESGIFISVKGRNRLFIL